MSAKHMIVLFCDGCGSVAGAPVDVTATILRQRASKIGWKNMRVEKSFGVTIADYCPKCYPSVAAKLKAAKNGK